MPCRVIRPRTPSLEVIRCSSRVSRRQGHGLPALGAKADVTLDEFPDEEPLVGEKSRSPKELLSYLRGCSTVVDDRSDRLSEFVCQMRKETCRLRFVLLVDSQEAVAKDQNLRVWIVAIG